MRLICSPETESGERCHGNHEIDFWFRKSPEVRQDGAEADRNREFRTLQRTMIRTLDQSRMSVDMQQRHLQYSPANASTTTRCLYIGHLLESCLLASDAPACGLSLV